MTKKTQCELDFNHSPYTVLYFFLRDYGILCFYLISFSLISSMHGIYFKVKWNEIIVGNFFCKTDNCTKMDNFVSIVLKIMCFIHSICSLALTSSIEFIEVRSLSELKTSHHVRLFTSNLVSFTPSQAKNKKRSV